MTKIARVQVNANTVDLWSEPAKFQSHLMKTNDFVNGTLHITLTKEGSSGHYKVALLGDRGKVVLEREVAGPFANFRAKFRG